MGDNINGFLKKNDWLVTLIVAGITLAFEYAVFFGPMAWSVSRVDRLLAVLAFATAWVALIAPTAAATGEKAWASIFRGGIICDSTAVFLLTIFFWVDELTILSVLKIYLILISVFSLGWSFTRIADSRSGKFIGAVCGTLLLFALLTTPFWISGILNMADEPAAGNIARLAVNINPLYAVFSTVADKTEFVWHFADRLYRITSIGQDVAVPSVKWYNSLVFNFLLAGLALSIRLVRHNHHKAA